MGTPESDCNGDCCAAGVRAHTAICAGLVLVLALASCHSPPLAPHEAELDEAEAALAVGEFDQALAGFRNVTQLAAADPRGWEGLALSQIALGDDAAALAAFSELDGISSEPLAAPLARVRCSAARRAVTARFEAGRVDEARAELAGPAVAGCSEAARRTLSVDFYLAAARAAGAASDSIEARRAYRRVLEVEPGHEAASLALAAELLSAGDLGDLAEAVQTLRAALAVHPRSRELVHSMVEALTQPRRAASAPGRAR